MINTNLCVRILSLNLVLVAPVPEKLPELEPVPGKPPEPEPDDDGFRTTDRIVSRTR
jgi:hypothetical protein